MKKVFRNILLSFSLFILMSAEAKNAYGYDTVSPDQLALAGITRQEWNYLVAEAAKELEVINLKQKILLLRSELKQLNDDKAFLLDSRKKAEEDGEIYDHYNQFYELANSYRSIKMTLQRLERELSEKGR